LPKHFPRKAFQWSKATRQFCIIVLLAPGRAEGRQTSGLLGWVASSNPNYSTLPKHFSRRAFRLSKTIRNFSACVASRNLRNTPTSHLKTVTVGSGCTVRHGARHMFLRTPGQAGGRPAKEPLNWIASVKPAYSALPTHVPRRTFRMSKTTRTFCICRAPLPSEHFDFTLQDCGSGQKLQSAAWGVLHFSPSPGHAG
jgi:hypothetical protein